MTLSAADGSALADRKVDPGASFGPRAWSPDLARILRANLTLLDLASGTTGPFLHAPGLAGVTALPISADGKRAAADGRTGLIRLLDLP